MTGMKSPSALLPSAASGSPVSGPPLSGEESVLAASSRGQDYLERVAWPEGIQSQIGIDAGFNVSFPPAKLRAFVADRFGLDIGFDAGKEAFSSMIALKLFGNAAAGPPIEASLDVVRSQAFRGRYRFFCHENGFAADTDCTAVAAASLYEVGGLSDEQLLTCGEELLRAAAPATVPATANLDDTGNSDGELHAGVVMVYWDDGVEPGAGPRGYKHDAAAAANALYTLMLGTQLGLQDSRGVIAATLRYINEHLRSGAYLAGTRYYPAPETFLLNASCICRRFPVELTTLADELRAALAHRDAAPASPGAADNPAAPLNVAQRLLTAYNLDADTDTRPAIEALTRSQHRDGSWPAAPYFTLGKRALYFGSPAVTTMFVIKAIQQYLLGITSAGHADASNR